VSITTPGGELAQLEFRRLSTVAWLAIALICSVLALIAENPIQQWQLLFVLGAVVFSLISYLIQVFGSYESSYLPLMFYLLIAPIVLGDTPEKAWISYGVLTVFANLYISTIYRQNLAIALMLVVTIFQIWVLNQNLTSLSDRADMKLLYTYFSSLWTPGTGMAFLLIRKRYLESSERIEDEITLLKERISARFQSISLQNRDDYRNLKLHGTILNTLIFAKNNPEFVSNRQSLFETLRKELKDLQINRGFRKEDLEISLREQLGNRTLNRIRISRIDVSGRISDASLENNVLEIVREILLNLEKHTTVAEVSIKLDVSIDGNILLRISESAHYEVLSKSLQVRKADALKSESLKRLLAVVPSQLAISTTPDGFGLVYTVTNLEATDRAGDPREIYRLRSANAVEFAENIGKATAMFGFLFLPGYFALGIDADLLVLLTLHAVLVGYSVLNKSRSKLWLSLSALLSLSLPVLITQGVQECADVSYLPWLLNTVMMSAFIFATEVKNKYLRWVPIVIITIEMLVLPQSYPAGCQDIFLGSIPAIPIIIAFALVMGSLRKRLYKQDAEQISSAFVDESNVRKYEEALEMEYSHVITELEEFRDDLFELNSGTLSARIDNEIQKIRAFLVCSEQFESQIVREVYLFAITRLRNGVPTRLSILGDFIYQLDQSANVDLLLAKLTKILEDVPCEISLVKLRDLTFEISVEPKYIDRITPELDELAHTLTNISVHLNSTSN
jgi:hypothetical protein